MIGHVSCLRGMMVVGASVVLWQAGCVKRGEVITVHPDGSVEVRLAHEGDRKDMEEGVPALVGAPGWTFEEELNLTEKDEERITRTAVTTFAPGQPLPDVYPMDDVEWAESVVQHPTTLIVEPRGLETYYHFRRVYKSMPWAYVKDWERILIEEPLEKSGNPDLDELSPERKRELVGNIIRFDAMKHLTFARRAAMAMVPPMAQDDWLRLRRALLAATESVDIEHVLELLEARDQRAKNNGESDELSEMAEQLRARIEGVIAPTLRELRMGQSYIAEFERKLERERRAFLITEDYQDETWEIAVHMPGHVVGHNADKIDGNEVKWEFDGRRFFDREHELLVSSKVLNVTGR